jgi:hypothetical protein
VNIVALSNDGETVFKKKFVDQSSCHWTNMEFFWGVLRVRAPGSKEPSYQDKCTCRLRWNLWALMHGNSNMLWD